ncbi:unknown protein [Klebsormidium nitens]|uniref:DDHD domain-containing protein n=1 Tax=Klebsormidium nitens TaxID=105231 RepID=A0A1Y1I2I6_KLENI|nr:unknown protein [Klebsormidium nitens]|eukprot:GAQ85140.1 unknown protein [Klebsormidium nitens]
MAHQHGAGSSDSTEPTMKKDDEFEKELASQADELRWPSPPARRPVLDLPKTPPKVQMARDSTTYFEALKGRAASNQLTNSPSDGADVRWFFSKKALRDDQAAALVPSTEAALKGEWLRFGTLDSAALEAAYRQQEEMLLSCWWREFAEVSIGPQLKDRERLERGAGATTQGSPQASPLKAAPRKIAKAAQSPAPAGKRLQEDLAGASPLKEPPSNKAAPAAQERPPNTDLGKKEQLPPIPIETDAEQAQESFFSKVSSYLPSFRSQSGPLGQSPSKPQPSEKPAKNEGEKAGLDEIKVDKELTENSLSEGGTAGKEGGTGKGDSSTRGEEDTATEASTSVGQPGDVEAAHAEKLAAELKAAAEISSAEGSRRISDAAPLTEVSDAATVDADSSQAGSVPEPPKSTASESDDSSEIGIQVKGGLYECFLEKRKLSAIFWKAGHRRILRGSWFAQPRKTKDWLPLREDIAEQLEIAYRGQVWRRRSFLPNGMYAHRVNIAGPSLGLYALFTGEDDTWEAWLGVDGSGVISRMFSAGHPTTRLRRGFRDEGAPVGQEEHLVFMVHGIGQRLERANIVDDAHKFQAVSDAMLDQFLKPHQRQAQRVLFIPCQVTQLLCFLQWRKMLQLGDDWDLCSWRKILQLGGENIIDDITMEGIRGIRQIVNATVLDVLYYMSPVYCQDIVNSVCRSLNRQYARFRRRNPGFDGQVHIFGHSLGSVLSYDILCHQPKPFLTDLHARLLASAAPAKPASTAGGALSRIPEDPAGDPPAAVGGSGADVGGSGADVSGEGWGVRGGAADVSQKGTEGGGEKGGAVDGEGVEGSGVGVKLSGEGESNKEFAESVGRGWEIGDVIEKVGALVGLENEDIGGIATAEAESGAKERRQDTGLTPRSNVTRNEGGRGETRNHEGIERERERDGGKDDVAGKGAGETAGEEDTDMAQEGGEEKYKGRGFEEEMQENRSEQGTRAEGNEGPPPDAERGDSGTGAERAEHDSGVPVRINEPTSELTSAEAGAERVEQGEETGVSKRGGVLGEQTIPPASRSIDKVAVEEQPTPGASEESGLDVLDMRLAEAAGMLEGGGDDTGSGPPRNESSDAELAALRAEVAILREKLRRWESSQGNEAVEKPDSEIEIANGEADGSKRALSFAEKLAAVSGEGTEDSASGMGKDTGDDRSSLPERADANAGRAHRDVSQPSGDASEGSGGEPRSDVQTSERPSGAEARATQPASIGAKSTASVDAPRYSSVHIPESPAEIQEALRSAAAEPERPVSRPLLISTPSVDVRLDDLKSTLDAEVLRKRGPHAFVHYPRLAFEVDTFFAVGSPLGMFLALRNIEFGSATRGENMDLKKLEESMPAARHMVNIFHPYDPVAYRIEPLVSKDFVARRPVFIPYHRGGQRLHIGMQQLRDDLSARSRALQNDIISSLSSMKTKIASTFGGADQASAAESEEGGDEVSQHTALVMERVTGSKHGRIDFMLQDATFEHPYISALSSHTAYWKDEDTALFVTRHLYRNVPEAPPGQANPVKPGEANPVIAGEADPVNAGDSDPVNVKDNGELTPEKGTGGDPGDRKGPRSRQGSTGNLSGLKRSLSVGDQLAKEDDLGGSSLGSLFWGGGGRRSGLEGVPTEFDTWIADDETGLFYMPGGSTPSKSKVSGFRQEDTSESESEEAMRGVRQLAERER